MRLVVACVVAGVGTANADRLSADDLERKNERGYITGLPLVAYSTDLGFGGGARAYYYWNGHRTDDRFDDTPYLHRIFFQVFAATRGVQFHWLDYDAPNVLRSPYRVRGQLIYGRNTNSNYFGLGNSALAPLSFPGSPLTYDSFGDYAADQKRIQGGTTWSKYDNYDLTRPILLASIERNFWHDRIRVLGGVGITYAGVDDYTGEMVDAVDDTGAMTTATMATTRLRAECDAGLLVGCDGGRDNLLRLGISYDTRDFEPDPNRGIFVDVALDVGTVALGSEFDYVRFLTAARGYWSPTSGADLVLGGRVLFQVQSKGTPFFGMDTLSFTEDPRTGLGGHRTLRGFRQDRFVGPVMSALNLEARWTFVRGTLWKQKLGLILAPFFDVGRPFDTVSDVTLSEWKRSYGGALRISWNLATIITFDYGRSSEDAGFYANFSHMF